MSEILEPDEPLYEGGTMSASEWMQLECEYGDMPPWKSANIPRPFEAKINGERTIFRYHRTRGWLFDGEYGWMSFICLHEGRDLEYLTPDEIGMEGFQTLYSALIDRGFHIGNRRTPTNEAYNLHHQEIRGDEPIESILGRIVAEEEFDE